MLRKIRITLAVLFFSAITHLFLDFTGTLRWNLQRGVVVIPKSVHKERVVESFNIRDFSLASDEMNEITALDTARPLIFDYENPDEVRRIYGIRCPV